MIGLSAVRVLAGRRFLDRATSTAVGRCLTISSDGFDTTSSPMLTTSAGAPEKLPAPSGTPGDPVTLKRCDQLMARDRSTCSGRFPVADW